MCIIPESFMGVGPGWIVPAHKWPSISCIRVNSSPNLACYSNNVDRTRLITGVTVTG